MAKYLLKFGGEISKKERTIIGIIGAILIFTFWVIITIGGIISPGILPSPFRVFETLPSLINEYHLFNKERHEAIYKAEYVQFRHVYN